MDALCLEVPGLLLQHLPAPTGWQTPETALLDAHKLLRSIVVLLMGSDVLSAQKTAVESAFLDYGEASRDCGRCGAGHMRQDEPFCLQSIWLWLCIDVFHFYR